MPGDYNYYFNHGVNDIKRGEYDSAVKNLKDALDIDPKQPIAWLNLSTAYVMMGKINESIEATRSIMKFHPDLKTREDLLKYIFSLMGDQDKLKEMCETALKDPDQTAVDWGIIGSYFLVNEQYDKAVKAHNYYLKKNMDSPIHWLNLGIALLKKGEHESAISACKKALQLNSSFKYGWGHLASTYLDMGRNKEALDACHKALEIDPLYSDALELLKEIKTELGETIPEDEDPMEVYQGQEVKKSQKEVLLEIEKSCGKPVPPVVQIRYNNYRNSFGFVSKSGYIIGLGFEFVGFIPESIGKLKYLKKLSIPHSYSPKGLPESIAELQKLEEFKYSFYVPGATIPGMHTKPIILDEKICELKVLKRLDLSDNYGLTELPKGLAQLPVLQEINITNCHNLSTIPEEIKQVFDLKKIKHNECLMRNNDKIKEPSKPIPLNILPEDRIINYSGQDLFAPEAIFLQILEKQLFTPIPHVEEIKQRSFGFTSKDSHVLELYFFDNNYLTQFPKEISNLKFLRKLVISQCRGLESLSENFGKLGELKELIINGAPLKSLPNNIGDLSQLETLSVTGTYITALNESIGNLHNLKILILNSSRLETIPDTIGNLNNLEKLEIVRITNLKLLPETISTLKNLKEFRISNCQKLTSIPKGIYSLKNLQKFEIVNCVNLSYDPLEVELTNNYYQGIILKKEEKRTLLELEKIIKVPIVHIIDGEGIRTSGYAGRHFTADKEHVISLEIHGISTLPDSIENLSFLGKLVIHGPVGTLSENIGKLKSLKVLIIAGCRSLKTLPESLGDLETLEHLVIRDYVELSSLPSSIGRLEHLKILEIESCPKLQKLPESIKYLPSLKKLVVKKCSLNDIPEELLSIKSLEVLDLTHNPINPFSVYDKYINNLITEEQGIHLLKWMIEGSDDPVVRVDSLETLEKILVNSNIIPRLHNTCFQILENSLITDDRGFVRNIAAQKVISHFPQEGIKSLQWVAENDKSLPVLKVLYDNARDIKPLTSIHSIVMNRLSTFYNVIPEELKIIMDFHIRQGYDTTYYSQFSRAVTETSIERNFFERYGSTSSSEVIFDRKQKGYYSKFYAVHKGHIISLDLNNLGLETVPESLNTLSKLQFLDLSCNKLTVLPNWLGSLPLQFLDLSYNQLSELPQNINLSLIPQLNVSHNYLLRPFSDKIMEQISQKYRRVGVDKEESLVLASLEIIIGKKINKTTYMEDVRGLDKAFYYKIDKEGHIIGLFIHDFEEYRFTSIPEGIFSLLYLKELDFSDNFYIQSISPSIKNLVSLEYLNLNNNDIELIPDELLFLKNLVTLKLGGNRIAKLPPAISNLQLLRILELNYNHFKEITPTLCKLNKLEYLGLEGNKISKVPECINSLSNLYKLFLGFNKLEFIPLGICDLPRLKILSLPGNYIRLIPAELNRLDTLKSLYIMGNKIDTISEDITTLKNLEYIDISDNQITSVLDSFTSMEALNHLDVSYNPIESIKPSINAIKGFIFKKFEPYY